MSKVAIAGNASGTGTFTIAAPNSNTDRTLTLPDEAGTVLTSASETVLPKGVPIFYVTKSGNQTLTSNTSTQVTFNTVQTDSHSYYSTSTNKFTPLTSGWYQVNVGLQGGTGAIQGIIGELRKNGTVVGQQSTYLQSISYGDDLSLMISKLVYFNGSTDYIEVYATVVDSSAGTDVIFGGFYSWFEAILVRGA